MFKRYGIERRICSRPLYAQIVDTVIIPIAQVICGLDGAEGIIIISQPPFPEGWFM